MNRPLDQPRTFAAPGFFALVGQSLRLDARSVWPHVGRLVLAVSVWSLFLTMQFGQARFGAVGPMMFTILVMGSFALITIAGIGYLATPITEEKEQQTLGLLKIAGINSASILFGKSAPRAISGVLLLAAQAPMAVACMTFGGVTIHQLLAAAAALLAYLLLAAGIGLLSSVVARRSTTASLLALLLLSASVAMPPILMLIYAAVINIAPEAEFVAAPLAHLSDFFAQSSAYSRCRTITGANFAEPIISTQVISNAVCGIIAYGLACVLFPVYTRDDAVDAPPRPPLAPALLQRRQWGVGRAWSNAFLWKDLRFVAGSPRWLFWKTIAYAAVWAVIYVGIGGLGADFAATMTVLLLMSWEIAAAVCRSLQREVQGRTLSSLLILPHSLPSIIYSKLLGAAAAALPATVVLVIALIVAADPSRFAYEVGIDTPLTWMWMAAYVMCVHVAALLSITSGRGALPLAFLVTFGSTAAFLGNVDTYVRNRTTMEVWYLGAAIVHIVASVFLHVFIGRQLKSTAARQE